MKHYTIRRFKMVVCEFDGAEEDLLTWIRNNVPPATGSAPIRSKDVLINRRLLYEDADAAGIEITQKRIKDETETEQES